MELTDLLPLEKWVELEKEINSRSGLGASVFNTDGIRITNFKKWPNRLCPVIKANEKGQSFICAVAHMNLAAQARKTQTPVIEECDAGLAKVVVPIFVGDEFLGAVGGCGLLLDSGEVDTFMVNKTIGIDEEELKSLSDDMGSITTEQAKSLVAFLQEQLNKIISDYEARK